MRHGETITLVHDCTLPRPYSRNYKIHGTRATYNEDAKGIYIDGVTKHEEGDWMHSWEPFENYLEKYEHPLWKTYASESEKHGHGGMDYLVFSAFVESAMYDLEPPIDVYDAATWMAITCLSEQSIAMGSMPVPVPDFTNACGSTEPRQGAADITQRRFAKSFSVMRRKVNELLHRC